MSCEPRQCFCRGPQNGEPRCPCAMRNVQIVNGRYVQPAQDLGPIVKTAGRSLRERIESAEKLVELKLG